MSGSIAQIPPPVGGLNARDAITSMPPQDALVLTNLFPEASYVRIRPGSEAYATGLPGAVESLLEYGGPTRQFFAASGAGIYDISSAGAVGAAVVSSLTNARWQSTMFSNAGGTYLVAVNGADGVRTYSGSAWATQTITGAAATTFNSVTSYARRLWFTAVNSSKVYYLGADAISGAATTIDMGGVWRTGGICTQIIALAYSTQGSGLTQYVGFVSSNGEIAIYEGNDPTSSATWNLVGIYKINPPVSPRAWVQNGGDVAIFTNIGVVSLLSQLGIDLSTAPLQSASYKILNLISDDWRNNGSLYGWEIRIFANEHAMILNVPTGTGTFDQYVMNTLTGAWCRFTGWNSYTFGLYGGNLFYGANGSVVRAWTGLSDQGTSITATLNTAFNTIGSAGASKRFTMIRPLLQSNANPLARLGIDVDYAVTSALSGFVVTYAGALWDVGLWNVDLWAGEAVPVIQWATVGGIGRAVSVKMTTNTVGIDLQINGFDLMMELPRGPSL